MLRVIKSILVAGCVFTTVINGVVIYDAINSIAHAGEIINNYDADGNLIGHSEIVHETDEQAVQRMQFETMAECVRQNVQLHFNQKCF